MAPRPERKPARPVSSGARVKPQETEYEEVPAAWLMETEHLPSAENVDRLAADYDLITGLALAGFVGRDWEYFSTELARYGIAVIGGWMARKMIFEKCRSRGHGGLPELERQFTTDEIAELTGETVAVALVHFRNDVLMTRKWDYRKGATLRTYFIGQCIIRFANIYRRWWSNESRSRRTSVHDDLSLLEYFGPQADGVDRRAIDRAIIAETFAVIKNPRVRAAMIMTAEGRTQAEIAGELGVTEKTVERMLANQRERLRGMRAG